MASCIGELLFEPFDEIAPVGDAGERVPDDGILDSIDDLGFLRILITEPENRFARELEAIAVGNRLLVDFFSFDVHPVAALEVTQDVMAVVGARDLRVPSRDTGIEQSDLYVGISADDSAVSRDLVELTGERPAQHEDRS